MDKSDVEALAKELNINIPGNIPSYLWPLPIMEALLDRIRKLEDAVYGSKNYG